MKPQISIYDEQSDHRNILLLYKPCRMCPQLVLLMSIIEHFLLHFPIVHYSQKSLKQTEQNNPITFRHRMWKLKAYVLQLDYTALLNKLWSTLRRWFSQRTPSTRRLINRSGDQINKLDICIWTVRSHADTFDKLHVLLFFPARHPYNVHSDGE